MTLTHKQRVAVQALADGESVQAAADAAGVHRRTVTRWKGEDPAFVAELRHIQFGALERLSGLLLAQGDQVAGAVTDGLADGDMGIRLRAAGLWLDRVPGLLALVDFEERLRTLERRINEPESV